MTRADWLPPAPPATGDADGRAGEAQGCAGEPFAAVTETHSAVVFFAGDRAYKLKKPVNPGFLDFTSPQARAVACRRETELNRRFAPDVYLGVAEIRGPDGRICDHLVVMRRMPAGRRLSALVTAHAPVDGALRQVARVLAAWHAAAPRSPQIAAQGGRDALRARWQANVGQARECCGHLLEEAGLGEIERLAGRFTAGRAALFAERIRAGRVVDGHGDLLADDIFCLEDGVRILDCLEFDDRLRWLDGLDDASFLAMDLERLGAPDLARRFTSWYAEYSGDPAPACLRHHYVAYRAFVRAKVACLRARAGDGQAAAEAWQLAGMTLAHLRAGAVTLVLAGGLPGTGKTTLAGALADRLEFTVLSSDRIRKELAGVPAGQRCAAPWGTGIYTASWTERVYSELLIRARRLLALGESVIADASFISPAQRAAAAAVAAAAHADLVQLRCAARAEVAGQRLAARTGGISDADAAIARQMAAVEAPWPGAVTIDTSQLSPGTAPVIPAEPPAAAVQQAMEAIRPHRPEHMRRPVRPVMLPD
jgi:aminoglycoside phosphotransferase family enzyme/predicted kinase